MNVLKSIYNILSNDADVSGIVSSRIYPAVVPQKIADPYVEFDCYSTEPTDTKTSSSILDVYLIEISAYHTSSLDCVTLSTHIRGALDRYKGLNAGNVIDKFIFDGQDGPYYDHEKELYRVDTNIRARVKIDPTNPAAAYTVDYEVYVFGSLTDSGSFDPTQDVTFNISAT